MTAAGTFVSGSEDETIHAGAGLSRELAPGSLVILTGPLGAGKTAFVRGMAVGLGLDPERVHSPSFTLVTEYGPSASGARLAHIDLYRLDRTAEVEELGLDDYLASGWFVAVEWGERLPSRLQSGAARVILEDAGGDSRRITLTPSSSQLSPSQ